jgi:uncharacterized membrane protein YkvA (DUF1232 family)
MRVTLQLEPSDIARFHEALARADRLIESCGEPDIVHAAKYALDHLPIASAPGYVRTRIQEVQRLITMLEDEAWALPRPQRIEVSRVLAYFSDPEDMIPDNLGVIGLLDDAIMLEILLRSLRRVINAYTAFCDLRRDLGPVPGESTARIAYAGELARYREQLFRGMRRRPARNVPDLT